MKPVLQAVLFLGLITPSFSAAPNIDFDGIGSKSMDIVQEIENNPETGVIAITPQAGRVSSNDAHGTIKVEVAYKSASGEWIVQEPVKEGDGLRAIFYPDDEIRTTYSCTTTNPNPSPNYWRVSSTYIDSPYGHPHTNPVAPKLQTPTGEDLPDLLVSPFLSVNTPFVFYWRVHSPAYATRITRDATFSYACTGTSRLNADMIVPGLVAVKAGTGYTLGGTTTEHPSPLNHYVTEDLHTQLTAIGQTWKATCSESDPLIYNDMSLPRGGLFDITGQWKTSHKLHRFGNNADISKKWVRKGNRAKLVQMMCNYVQVHSEGDKKEEEPQPHYHLTLKTSKHLDDFPDPLDERYMDCCLSPVPAGCIKLETNGDPMEEVLLPVTTDCP